MVVVARLGSGRGEALLVLTGHPAVRPARVVEVLSHVIALVPRLQARFESEQQVEVRLPRDMALPPAVGLDVVVGT